MPNTFIQQYFNRVLAWLRNFHILHVRKNPNLLIDAGWLIGAKKLDRALEDRFLCVLDSDGKGVMQRTAMGEVDNNGAPKKVWINITLRSAKPVNKLPR